MKFLAHLSIFISGIFRTSAEIYPIYVFIYAGNAAKSVRLHEIFIAICGGLLIIGSTLDLLIKYMQILVLYVLYISARRMSVNTVYKLHLILYSFLLFSLLLSINPDIQNLFFQITRNSTSATELLAYTGGIAGYAPEPSYMGSIMGALLLSIYCLRKILVQEYAINFNYLLIAHILSLFLLKSIMAILFFMPVLFVFLLYQSKIAPLLITVTTLCTYEYWLPQIDTLDRIDKVLTEVAALNSRPDADFGSTRGYIFERFIDNLDEFGFVFTRELPFDFDKAVGIADFLAVTIAPSHTIVLLLIIIPFGIKQNLKILYFICALSLCFWTPTLLAFHAFALGAIRYSSRHKNIDKLSSP